MKHFKVGDKVEILDAEAIEAGVRFFKTGDITTIAKATDRGGECRVYVAPTLPGGDSDALYLYGTEMQYIRKVPNWLSVTDRSHPVAVPAPKEKTVPTDAMTTIAEELTAMRKLLERIVEQDDGASEAAALDEATTMIKGGGHGFQSMYADVETYKATSDAPSGSNVNKARERVIEDAAKFVATSTKINFMGNRVTRLTGSKVEFLVFANERKVVVKIHYRHELAVGVAQCHPDDTFNETLGLGIALARAIGEPGAARRLAKAPQPDEMAPGSVVASSPTASTSHRMTVERVRPRYSGGDSRFEFSDWERGYTYHDERYGMRWSYIHHEPHVLDDTRADYSLAAKKRGGL